MSWTSNLDLRRVCKKGHKLVFTGVIREYVTENRTIRREHCRKCLVLQVARSTSKKKAKAAEKKKLKQRQLKEQTSKIDTRASAYRITAKQLTALTEAQDNLCAICGEAGIIRPSGTSLCIDHNHTTSEVRGLLCSSCNSGLGLFKDNPDILRYALKYLEYSL